VQQVADGVFHVSGSAVNWYLVSDGQALTLVDCGYPGDIGAVAASIRELGRSPGDVQAVLLTHAHVDHSGGLNHLWEEYRVPVFMHPLEVPNARGQQREQATPLDVVRRAWRPRVARWAVHVVRAGGTKRQVINHAQEFGATGALDLPGAPVPIHCPGHTSGHTAYLLPSVGALLTGDALVTGHAISGRRGPQQLPAFFANSPSTADESMDRLAHAEAEVLLPGHGDPWRGDPAQAVAMAREQATPGANHERNSR
jgi:glyoxylase-like metal-dependent hydrolase (beta-lactamase superfamily II)